MGNTIDIRRLRKRMPCGADFVPAKIVDEYENDVGT
jgi:hypothetical protein